MCASLSVQINALCAHTGYKERATVQEHEETQVVPRQSGAPSEAPSALQALGPAREARQALHSLAKGPASCSTHLFVDDGLQNAAAHLLVLPAISHRGQCTGS